jgi:acyl carrier protein
MREQVKQILAAALGLKPSRIGDDASVSTIEEWDSVRQIKLIMAVEDKFGVIFDDDEISELNSLNAFVQSIERKQAARSQA